MPHKFWLRRRVFHQPSGKYGTVVIVDMEPERYGVELDMDSGEKHLLYPIDPQHLEDAEDYS